MLRVSQVNQSIDEPMERLHQRICKKLRIRERDLIRFSIYRESVDARRRPIRFSYVVDCEVADEQQVLRHAGTDVTVVRERPFVLPAAGSERRGWEGPRQRRCGAGVARGRQRRRVDILLNRR